MTKQTFRLGHVLSVTTGVLLCEGEDHPIDGVYKILNFLTGDNLYTHQLPAASKQCAPYILKRFPDLACAPVSGIGKDNWKDAMAALRKVYGDSFELEPLPESDKKHRTPFDDLPEKFRGSNLDPRK